MAQTLCARFALLLILIVLTHSGGWRSGSPALQHQNSKLTDGHSTGGGLPSYVAGYGYFELAKESLGNTFSYFLNCCPIINNFDHIAFDRLKAECLKRGIKFHEDNEPPSLLDLYCEDCKIPGDNDHCAYGECSFVTRCGCTGGCRTLLNQSEA